MKCTEIVRKVDKLGRVVIPIELRRSLLQTILLKIQVSKNKKALIFVLICFKLKSTFLQYTIFEFRDTNIRSILNHIQKEKQQHVEQIYTYMAQNGIYNKKLNN